MNTVKIYRTKSLDAPLDLHVVCVRAALTPDLVAAQLQAAWTDGAALDIRYSKEKVA